MNIDIDVIGTMYTPGTYDAEGNELTPSAALDGYHVNTTYPVADWAAYKVTPATPRRVFGGHETHFYTFADLAEYEVELETADLTAQEVPVVPQSISMRQARLALQAAGLLDTVQAAIDAAPATTRIEWETATSVERNWPTLLAMQAALGLSDADLDGLFMQASTL